jgi:hypothetical protein
MLRVLCTNSPLTLMSYTVMRCNRLTMCHCCAAAWPVACVRISQRYKGMCALPAHG